jgi:hypothetical protein
MNNKTILAIVGVVGIVGIVFFATRGGSTTKVSNNTSVYCSSDGTLVGTMPIQSHRSYCIKSDSKGKTYSVNSPSEYSFFIVDDQGNTLKDFAVTHTKQMHVIVTRKDLAYFQHIHPEFNQTTGVFTFKNLTFPADGLYRIFADFAPTRGQMDAMGTPLPVTLSEDVPVGTGAQYAPQGLGPEEKAKTFNGYQVSLSFDQPLVSGKEVMLAFDLKQNGKSITDLEQYLGALGHSVILREDNLDFIHAHPVEKVSARQTGKVDFMVDFPEAGKYKVFTQFQRGGKVFTTDFVVTVAQSASSSNADIPSTTHMMH